MATVKDAPVIRLTLDQGLQKVLEPLARDRAIALGPNISVAIIVVDNENGDVLSRVGSADYFDDSRAGQVDMTRAVRSPGSTLQDLALLYAGLPRLGTTHPLHEIMSANDDHREPRRLMDQVAAWQVGNVLLGTPPPANAAANRIAFKTGTSYGSRDAWSVGFDGHVTIAVWVGRPDGAPVPGLVGRTAAAPI